MRYLQACSLCFALACTIAPRRPDADGPRDATVSSAHEDAGGSEDAAADGGILDSDAGDGAVSSSPYPWTARRVTKNDDECDGMPERCSASLYDEAGHEVMRGTDDDCDGRPESCMLYGYAIDGRRIGVGTDDDCDGELETCTDRLSPCAGALPASEVAVTVYDSQGRLTLQGIDTTGDGEPDKDCHERNYDASGRLTSAVEDGNCGGRPSWCAEYTYDLITQIVTETIDDHGESETGGWKNGCDGTPDECNHLIYDAAGNLTARGACDGPLAQIAAPKCDWQEQDCRDPSSLACSVRHYDTKGRTKRVDYDPDCDGTPDSCSFATREATTGRITWKRHAACDRTEPAIFVTTYDRSGHAVAYVSSRPTLGGDAYGMADLDCYEELFDEAGRLISSKWDIDCDGPTDLWEGPTDLGWGDPPYRVQPGNGDDCRTWTYDAEGRVVADTFDFACDGLHVECRSWEYDAQGRVKAESGVHDCDEEAELTHYRFDAKGRVTGVQLATTCQSFEDQGGLGSLVVEPLPSVVPQADPAEARYIGG